jgi:hypothetical protein
MGRYTQQVGVTAVARLTGLRKLLDSNLGLDTAYAEVARSFA